MPGDAPVKRQSPEHTHKSPAAHRYIWEARDHHAPARLIVSVLSHAAILMASGGAIGAALLLGTVSVRGASGRPADEIAPYVPWLAVTALVMLATGVLAALGPARRALRINPDDALQDA